MGHLFADQPVNKLTDMFGLKRSSKTEIAAREPEPER